MEISKEQSTLLKVHVVPKLQKILSMQEKDQI